MTVGNRHSFTVSSDPRRAARLLRATSINVILGIEDFTVTGLYRAPLKEHTFTFKASAAAAAQ